MHSRFYRREKDHGLSDLRGIKRHTIDKGLIEKLRVYLDLLIAKKSLKSRKSLRLAWIIALEPVRFWSLSPSSKVLSFTMSAFSLNKWSFCFERVSWRARLKQWIAQPITKMQVLFATDFFVLQWSPMRHTTLADGKLNKWRTMKRDLTCSHSSNLL